MSGFDHDEARRELWAAGMDPDEMSDNSQRRDEFLTKSGLEPEQFQTARHSSWSPSFKFPRSRSSSVESIVADLILYMFLLIFYLIFSRLGPRLLGLLLLSIYVLSLLLDISFYILAIAVYIVGALYIFLSQIGATHLITDLFTTHEEPSSENQTAVSKEQKRPFKKNLTYFFDGFLVAFFWPILILLIP